jgi:hypothetical protein
MMRRRSSSRYAAEGTEPYRGKVDLELHKDLGSSLTLSHPVRGCHKVEGEASQVLTSLGAIKE